MIFIDTGAFIAKFLEKDQNHSVALKKWNSIAQHKDQCFTSNFVLDETFILLGRWVNYAFAAEKATLIYNSKQFTILRPNQNDELKAIEIFSKYADHKISFTDCISFVLIKNEKIKRAFSFDKHFSIMGINLI